MEKPIRLSDQHDVRTLALSPDGRWAATGSHHTKDGVKVWSLPEGRAVHQVSNPSDIAWAVFSPDGQWTLVNTSETYCVLRTGQWATAHDGLGTGHAFSPDSKLLAVAGFPPGTIRLIETQTGRLIASLEGPHAFRAMGAVFTPDGSRLIVNSGDSLTAHVWDLAKIRAQLAELGLDWDWPQLASRGNPPGTSRPLRPLANLGEFNSTEAVDPRGAPRDTSDAALEAEPEGPELFVRRGWAKHMNGKIDEAIADFTKALCMRPADPFILAARGEAKLQAGNFQDGLNGIETALASEPDQPDIQNAIAWFYLTGPIDGRDFAKALPHAQSAVRLNPSLHDLYTLALCYHHLNETTRADAIYGRARQIHLHSQFSGKTSGELEEFRAIAASLIEAQSARGISR